VPRCGNLSDAVGVTSHPVDEHSKCPCSPPLAINTCRASSCDKTPPSIRASTIAALQGVKHPPGCSDAACASASRGRSLK
jgi:hypothetical protein